MHEKQNLQIRIASYNIHGGVGTDKHFVPNRIVDVLREVNADVIALQEVESRTTGFDMLEFLASHLNLQAIPGPTLVSEQGDYGNGILTRLPVASMRRIDLSMPNREARGAIDIKLKLGDGAHISSMRVVATHLGLHPAERRAQVRQLLSLFEEDRNMPTILMGDVNEWFLIGRPLRWLHRHFKQTRAPATFPSSFPIFALDRIWAHPKDALEDIYAHRSPIARKASDHLPIVATMKINN